ncbi:hypothetical protein K437DRAFT_75488 [Tilletiaria anomala UBC 951]|uniref:Uncharacterized protein n=1 Tax=Tilletiaria anomala (strain ATCC 24038 / CBS 436.72 / UBC 951) TaxID=1037660 RepID=A0A066VAG3_TILAU|nr:uncharacterized protein K437DRAFT_75488 [Tilletiaria anomala UBC 951]KDN35585.1 hypothetical protein K437DRAFT_75488 [Tilletiaria anomala UBC 951]
MRTPLSHLIAIIPLLASVQASLKVGHENAPEITSLEAVRALNHAHSNMTFMEPTAGRHKVKSTQATSPWLFYRRNSVEPRRIASTRVNSLASLSAKTRVSRSCTEVPGGEWVHRTCIYIGNCGALCTFCYPTFCL